MVGTKEYWTKLRIQATQQKLSDVMTMSSGSFEEWAKDGFYIIWMSLLITMILLISFIRYAARKPARLVLKVIDEAWLDGYFLAFDYPFIRCGCFWYFHDERTF